MEQDQRTKATVTGPHPRGLPSCRWVTSEGHVGPTRASTKERDREKSNRGGASCVLGMSGASERTRICKARRVGSAAFIGGHGVTETTRSTDEACSDLVDLADDC